MSDSESSDDDFGPVPMPEGAKDRSERPARKRKRLANERVFVDALPKVDKYEVSYMHRDLVTHVCVSKATEFLITGSSDGHVKFWKKVHDEIDFVKHYQAHLGAINGMALSPDGKQLVTSSKDKMVKFFDVESFDMSSMIECDYEPTCVQWLPSGHNSKVYSRVVVGDAGCGKLRVYSTTGASVSEGAPVQTLELHRSPVVCLALNGAAGVVLSCDRKGMLEYWSCGTLDFPKHGVHFEMKSATDLYDLAKAKTYATHMSVSPDGALFSVLCGDQQIRVFRYATGKLYRKYDESVVGYETGQVSTGRMDEAAARERIDAEKTHLKAGALVGMQSAFDATGHFLVFPSVCGIKIVNLVSNKVVRTLGQSEKGLRFLGLALYQGTPQVNAQYLLAKKAAEAKEKAGNGGGGGAPAAVTVGDMRDAIKPDPTLFVTAVGTKRFYCFSNRDPGIAADGKPKDEQGGSEGGTGAYGRDILNEMPDDVDLSSSGASRTDKGGRGGGVPETTLPTKAVIRSSHGDIHLKLFPTECPRTVENFTTHAKNGYYNNVIFHRVIKGFMIQTGDPMGTGTGGKSIWGQEFEDEINRNLRHDRPFTLSMANAGPNTNGSQFFITCAATPWLDGKHTVFGRVTKGLDIVTAIENVPTSSKNDKPLTEVRMLSIDC